MTQPITSAGVFSALEVAGSGLTAQRGRMNIISSNLANVHTTRGANGLPYRRLDPVFVSDPVAPGAFDPVLQQVQGVRLATVRADPTPGQLLYEPGHPDANPQGYVQYPNVNVVTEMVNLMTASRAYEAGVTSIESIKAMARSALRIGQ
ncbi:MAG: flagellar basal body rod protein FlgC [Planctomycetota bacterium]